MKVACCAVGLMWVALCAPVLGKDVLLYKVSKGIHYQQTPAAGPTVLGTNGYVFEAQVFLPMAGTVTSAMVESTEGTDRVLALDGDDQFEFRNRVNSGNTLDTRYPDGPFRLTIDAVHDGRKVISLPLTGNTYPNAPRIVNLPQLQAVNAKGYAMVRWEAFSGGTAQDYIQLRIEESDGDRVFETRDLGEAGALDGTTTYALLDPDTLKPSTTYTVTLRFDKIRARDSTSYTGTLGCSSHHAVTHFTIATSPAGVPDVESYTVSKGRRFEQTTAGFPGPDVGDEFIFSADVKASAAAAVARVVLSVPAGGAITLITEGAESSFSDARSSQESLDSTYFNGTYTFGIETASQGSPAVPLVLAGDAYPPVPHLSNFNPTEPVRADRNLIFEWDAWADGNARDFIQLRIEDDDDKKVFETDDFGKNGALNGRATWAMVPAGTLGAGKTYKGRLVFTRVVALDTTSYPGALGMATYYSRTKFAIVAGPPDISTFRIAKGREYRQTGPSTVVPSGLEMFSASVIAAAPGALESATLTLPDGSNLPLVPQPDAQTFLWSESRSFPDGSYRLTTRGVNDGVRVMTLPLTGGEFPPPPLVNEFDATGQIFPFFDFMISWAPFVGGRSSDFILLEVLDRAGATVYTTADSMAGLNTAVMVPWEVLAPNALYTGRVLFERVTRVEDSAYPEVEGRIGYFSTTQWTMATLGDGNPATIFDWSRAADGGLQFRFPAIPGATYRVEGSSDLVNWAPVASVVAGEEQILYQAPPQPGASHYFYRAALVR